MELKQFSIKETNIIKGIAVIMLVFHHMYRTVDEITAREANPLLLTPDAISKIAFCFRICVYIFAFLTAYGITKRYIARENQSIFRFVVKRYIKLIVPYSFTLVCIWLVWFVLLKTNPLERYGYNIKYMVSDLLSVTELIGHRHDVYGTVLVYEFCSG